MINPVYPKINDNIPNYIKEEYPALHYLLIEYFKWLEQDENFIRLLIGFKENIEVNNQIDPYINIIKKELGWFYDVKLKVDDRTLIKLLRDFYLSRGTEKSFKILFRLLFNENVEITYPRDRLFKASDNNYIIEHRIITSANNLTDENFKSILNSDVLSASIKGKTSGLVLVIDKIIPQILNEIYYLIIYVNETINDFIPDELVEISAEGIGTFTEIIYSSTNINIINPGKNYKKNDKIIITGNTEGEGGPNIIGEIIIDTVSLGGIDAVGIKSEIVEDVIHQRVTKTYSSGINYKTGDKVIVTEGAENGWGFDARVIIDDSTSAEFDFTIANGIITGINITEEGIGYITKPKIVISDSRQFTQVIDAVFTCNEIIADYVGDVVIIDEGNNYITPIVTFSLPPSGIRATGTANVVGGKLKSITITNKGSGYIIPPTITLSENNSAITQTILMGSITDIEIISGGKNYDVNNIIYVIEPPESTQSFAKKPVCTIEISDGLIDDLKLINPGFGYTTIPNFNILNNSSGIGFTANLELLNDSSLNLIEYTSGQSYENDTEIIIDSPLNAGKIKYIDVINKGYNFQNLKNIKLGIISEFGNGAEIYPESFSIGKIEKIKIISDYWHYNKINNIINPNIIIESVDGTNALLEVDKNSCINRRLNRFENNSGLLEFNAFLHDSYYYQQFSYETNSKFPSIYSKEIINDLLHPAGFLKFDLFSDFVILNMNEITLVNDINTDGFLKITTGINFTYNTNEDLNFFISPLDIHIKKPEEFIFDNLFKVSNNSIIFNINNIEDIKYSNLFDNNLEYFKDYPMSAFTENQNITEMITLDIYKTLN